MRSRLAPVLAVTALFLASESAAAAEDTEALASCATSFNQCAAQCALSYREDEFAKAGCEAACAADRAVCEAREGYETAKPWVAEQFRNMQRFLEGFSEKGEPALPPSPPGDPRFDPPEGEAGEADPDAPFKDI